MLERDRADELYSIMGEFQEIAYDQESLLGVLEALESAYSVESQREGKFVANTVRVYLSALRRELAAAIDRLDFYVRGEARKGERLGDVFGSKD